MKTATPKPALPVSQGYTRFLIVPMVLAGMLSTTVQAQIWSEEFNYIAAPDSAVWSYDLGASGWGNAELQNYTSDPANVRIDGSNLVITAVRQGNSFTSARVKTQDKLTFKYGTVEARIQTPDLGNGLWPAFWTLGNNFSSVGWPACGEIDVMEMGSSGAIGAGVVNRRVASTAHWENNGGYAGYGLSKDYPAGDIDGTFVVYRMEWTPTAIKTYIDGYKIWEMNISGGAGSDLEEFHAPHFFILNLAVGGNYPGIWDPANITAPFPAEYRIDWIRLYDNGFTVLGGSSTMSPTPYYGTPLAVPGIIEAEDYDNGGQGVAYHDTGAVNDGGSYRPSEGVDIETCSEGGYNVGWTVAGEWMKYSVDVAAAGDYSIVSRVARGTAGTGAFHIEIDGVDVTGSIPVGNTGGWQNWVDKTSSVTLTNGEQIVAIVIEAGEVNINHLAFELVRSAPAFTTNPIVKASAEEYAAYTGQSLAGDAADADGDSLSFSGISGPAWLNVATNGALSGTPGNADVGLNSWTVQVSDGTDSATATLQITVDNVNDAPSFAADPLIMTNAVEDIFYIRSIADSVTDVDAGTVLTYSKVSGPAWLNVVTNGVVAGKPGNDDVGLNSWIVQVSDGIAAPVSATLQITVENVNDAPFFTVDPMSRTHAVANGTYSDTIAGSAADVDAGDTLSYFRISGPGWLNVATNGALSGTPGNTDVGLNSWTVQVSDGIDSATATLQITVESAPAPPALSTSVHDGDLRISFPTQDGVSYHVAYKSNLTNANWIPIETIIGDGNTNTVSYALGSTNGFYSVITP